MGLIKMLKYLSVCKKYNGIHIYTHTYIQYCPKMFGMIFFVNDSKFQTIIRKKSFN